MTKMVDDSAITEPYVEEDAKPSGDGRHVPGNLLSHSQLDLAEKRRRGKYAKKNERRATRMLRWAFWFLVLASLPYLVSPYLAVIGLFFPGAADASASVREVVPPLGLPGYILALPFAAAVAFAFLAGLQSGMRGQGRIGPVDLGAGGEGG